MKESATAAEGPSKLLTLKWKVGYGEVDKGPEKGLAGSGSAEAATEDSELAGKRSGEPIGNMVVDK